MQRHGSAYGATPPHIPHVPVALVISVLLISASTAFAYDLGARAGDKPPIHRQAPPADPTVLRQGGDAGDYVVSITPPAPPCILDCTGQMEYEPPLVDGYHDAHNGGCNSPEFGSPFQSYVWGWFCGTSGWYTSGGSNSRDTDWFEVSVVGDYTNPVMITVDAEQPTYVFELAPQDCGSVEVVQTLEVGPFAPGTISIPVEPGQETIWLWVGPTTFEGPVNEYKYTLFRDWWTTTETTSWSAVKGMFD